MRIHIIACRVLTRELSFYASFSPHIVDITWLPQGLHDTPGRLRDMLAATLADLEQQWDSGLIKHRPDAVALGYGLCSNGVVGLQAGSQPLIIPRTDDCTALFLGSQERYLDEFRRHSGTYWLNNGWMETSFVPMPSYLEERRVAYAQKYGEDNADFLLAEDLRWVRNYSYCGYIRSPVIEFDEYPRTAAKVAEENGWDFFSLDGDCRLLKKLTQGRWDDQEFLVCPPGWRVEAAYDGTKMRAVPPVGRKDAEG